MTSITSEAKALIVVTQAIHPLIVVSVTVKEYSIEVRLECQSLIQDTITTKEE